MIAPPATAVDEKNIDATALSSGPPNGRNRHVGSCGRPPGFWAEAERRSAGGELRKGTSSVSTHHG